MDRNGGEGEDSLAEGVGASGCGDCLPQVPSPLLQVPCSLFLVPSSFQRWGESLIPSHAQPHAEAVRHTFRTA